MSDDDKTGEVTVWNMSLRVLAAHIMRLVRSAFRNKRIEMIAAEHIEAMRKEYLVTTTDDGWFCDFGSAR